MEAGELGTFMVAACVVVTALQHPASPLRAALPDAVVRRVLTGLAMGATAVGIIHTPWGKRWGAHFNPSVTLTYLRLGKIAPWDARSCITTTPNAVSSAAAGPRRRSPVS